MKLHWMVTQDIRVLLSGGRILRLSESGDGRTAIVSGKILLRTSHMFKIFLQFSVNFPKIILVSD